MTSLDKLFRVSCGAFVVKIVVVSLLSLLPFSAHAEERVLSLREALSTAMGENPGLRASGQALLAVKEDIGIARSFILPKLFFEERFMRTDNPTFAFMAKLNQQRFVQQDFAITSLNNPEAVNDFQTSISFEEAVFAPKALIGIDMAKKESDAKAKEFERKKEEVALRVFAAYLGVQTSRAYVGAAEKAIEDAREHVRIAEARHLNDVGLYSDVLRTKVALSSAEEKLVSARKNLDVSKRALGLMLGMTESVDVKEERPVLTLNTLEYYYESSAARRDLAALERRYRNAENALRMANAGYLPVVGVGGSYQLNDHRAPFGAEGDSWTLNAFLRWELFDGAKREHERRKAKYQIAETSEYLEGLKKEIRFNVYEAYLGVEESKKGLDLATTSLSAAEEGTRLVAVRYENSLSTMADLLDAQSSLDGARARVIERESAYLTSLARLGYESGTILGDLGVSK